MTETTDKTEPGEDIYYERGQRETSDLTSLFSVPEGGREVLSLRELKSKWLKLMVAMLGWGEEEDVWSWVGRVRGGWAEQLQVLRSAPLMMMMMDAEEDLKTKWKKRWREAITGDGEMRIRDHMDDKEVQKRVKMVDTASFTVITLRQTSRIFTCFMFSWEWSPSCSLNSSWLATRAASLGSISSPT